MNEPPPPSDPAPAGAVALSPPQWYARLPCPNCGDTRRFESHPALAGEVGRPWKCKCGAVLGMVVVTGAETTMVRLACVAEGA